MKKTLNIICLVLLNATFVNAQVKTSRDYLYGNIAYGVENHWGNSGALIGLGFQRNLSKKLIFQTDFNWFDAKLLPFNLQRDTKLNEEYFSRDVFLSGALGYAIIGNSDVFNVTVKGGISLTWLCSKEYYFPNHTIVVNGVQTLLPVYPGHFENKNVVSYNLGLDFNFPIKRKQFLTVGFLTYSHEMFPQFLFAPIPVISYKLRL